MPAVHRHSLGMRQRVSVGLCCGLLWLGLPTTTHGICGLDAAALDQIRMLQDPGPRQAWARLLAEAGGTSCAVCHIAAYGPRNQYGTAINILLTASDREDSAWKREVGRRVGEIPADPSLPRSPTFGDLIGGGSLPAIAASTERPGPQSLPSAPREDITAEQARALVRKTRAESRFGILQLSRTVELQPEVAAALAEFDGEMVILGITSLSPDVARALAASRAATVWLHSVTALSPEAADALAGVRGNLVLTGLSRLDSVPLARKLARRPAALSLPYVKEIGAEVAAALAESPRSLSLAGLTDVPAEVQDALAQTVGALTVPNLTTLDSPALTRKLAAGFASAVLLPRVKTLSVEQAEVIAAVNRPFFLGGTLLPLDVISEQVATVFANRPAAGRLALVGRLSLGAPAITDPAFKILVDSPLPFDMLEAESISDEQLRILATAAGSVPGGPFGSQRKIGLPKLMTLDSALLAETLLRCSSGLTGVTTITPEAAAALGRTPEAARGKPEPGLNLPGLEELSPDTARMLMTRRWGGISLPQLRNPSPETVRCLVRQTSVLTLGIGTMTPELAAVFADMASDEVNLGGGLLTLPCLSELTPQAARILVQALNRGVEGRSSGLNRAPQLYIGGRGPVGLSPPLTPELAGELAKYRGKLSIAGLRTLTPESAAALAAYRGPYLELSGPGTDALSPEAAMALAALPGNLFMPIRRLDSVPLAGKFARQSQRTLDGLESLSAAAIPAAVAVKGFFTLRQLTTLDSPQLAARLIEDSTGQTLPALRNITPAAAQALIAGPSDILLGLRSLDDPAVARILTQAKRKVSMPRLRAATPAVVEILSRAPSIALPPPETLFILGSGGGAEDLVPP